MASLRLFAIAHEELSSCRLSLPLRSASPFAKTGGLADVVGALPPELVKLGHEVTVYLPLYACRAAALSRGELKYASPLHHHSL